jgi:SAM-dependent methyltransferase
MAEGTARGGRKREQVEAFAFALRAFNLPAGSTVVDCGSGSGHLSLPLAALFPRLHVVSLDFKAGSVRRLASRAAAAGLGNVDAVAGRIETYGGRCDAVVALHACGAASDAALRLAARHRAPFAVSPCCVGKLQLLAPNAFFAAAHAHAATADAADASAAGAAAAAAAAEGPWAAASAPESAPESAGPAPQSAWLRRQLAPGAFASIAKAADDPAAAAEASTRGGRKAVGASAPEEEEAAARRAAWVRCRRAKAVVELDRLVAAQEASGGGPLGTLYAVQGKHMGVYPKNDLLVSGPALAAVLSR